MNKGSVGLSIGLTGLAFSIFEMKSGKVSRWFSQEFIEISNQRLDYDKGSFPLKESPLFLKLGRPRLKLSST